MALFGESGLQKALRRRPDFGEALLDGGGLRRRHRRGVGRRALRRRQVPGLVAAHEPGELLFCRYRTLAARFDGLDAAELDAGGGRLEIDARDVAADVELRPGRAGRRGLSELIPVAGPRKFERPGVGGAKRRGRVLQRGGASGEGGKGDDGGQSADGEGGNPHGLIYILYSY